MSDPAILLVIGATFLVAGAVKGVIGLGLPTVSLGLLAVALDLPTAMALLIVPSFVTNLYQACAGGGIGRILRRIWPFLLMATGTVWIGAAALTRVDTQLLTALLGLLLVAYGTINLAGVRPAIAAQSETWAGPVFGLANGVLTGMTGSFVVPGVMFLQAIGLPRDDLVKAMGMLFTTSTVALAVALGTNALLSIELCLVSVLAVAPALIGMAAGTILRRRLSETQFRRIFFIAIVLLGLYILAGVAA